MTRDSPAARLRQIREAAGLSHPQMALLLDEDESLVDALESGASPMEPDLIDRCARVFGLSVRRFIADEVSTAPASLLFRSLDVRAIHELHAAGSHLALGDFLRSAGDVTELAKLRKSKGASDWHPLTGFGDLLTPVPDDDSELFRNAELFAYEVRDRLDLADSAVPSMIDLFENRLQIPIFWATPDEIDPNIDGASTRAPIPAVLVNLVGGSDRWWRTRMTLAHELCHLLFDSMPDAQHMVMFSPRRDRDPRDTIPFQLYKLPEPLERMERRANAFAAHFMAPGRAIRALVPRNEATSESAITLLCQHFHIGRVTAINQLTNVFWLSRQERARMIDRMSVESLPDSHPDAHVPRGKPPRCTLLEHWVDDSLLQGWIGAARARDYLGRRLTEPLPHSALPHPLRKPFRTEAQSIRLRIQAYLGRSDRTAAWQVEEPLRDGAVWRAATFEVDRDGSRINRGTVVMSHANKVISAETNHIFDPEQ